MNVYLLLSECYAAKRDYNMAIQAAQQAKAAGVQGADDYINAWKKK